MPSKTSRPRGHRLLLESPPARKTVGERIKEEMVERKLWAFIEDVLKAHPVTWEDVCSKRRFRRTVVARHAVWRALREMHQFSYPAIGKMFNVDHTTVITALRPPGDKRKRKRK